MTLLILDTGVLSLFQYGDPDVCRRVVDSDKSVLAATVISVEEQLSGWYTELRRATSAARLALAYQHITETIRFYSHFQILSFSQRAIAIDDGLKSQKLNVSRMDLRIASIAIEQRACLVTRNIRDFQRIPGLQIEDWTT